MKAYYLSLVKTDTVGGGGCTSDFKWRGWSEDFVGLKVSIPGFFGGRRIWQVFFWAWFVVGIFSGIQNNLKIRDSNHGIMEAKRVCESVQTNLLGNSAWDFFGLVFGPDTFFGFCWKPWGTLGFWVCPHSITDRRRHLKSWIPPGNR